MFSTNKTVDLEEITELTGDEYLLIHTDSGIRKVKVSTLTSGSSTGGEPPIEE